MSFDTINNPWFMIQKRIDDEWTKIIISYTVLVWINEQDSSSWYPTEEKYSTMVCVNPELLLLLRLKFHCLSADKLE